MSLTHTYIEIYISIVTKARSKPYQKVSVTDLKALSRSPTLSLSLSLPSFALSVSMSMLCIKASWLIHKQFGYIKS